MNLTDDQRAIVLGTMQHAGPEMDPDDQAFYLRHHVLCLDEDGRAYYPGGPTVLGLREQGLIEINPDTEGPVLTAAAIEAALGGSEVPR